MQLISWKANEYEAYPICDMVQSLCYMLETNLSYRYEKHLHFKGGIGVYPSLRQHCSL
mgnify:CR=1 FL=1